MDQKKIKSALKEAKEAIKNKEVDKALRLCQQVLKADEENYLGLVIHGAALQESKSRNEAPVAYRRAANICPDQILAWQGLASYYEKEKLDNVADDLLLVYKRLLILEKDETKWAEICKKVDGTIRCVKATENIREFASLLSDKNSTKHSVVACTLLNYFVGLKDIPDALLDICEKVVLAKLDGENDVATTEHVQLYVKILSKRNDSGTILAKREKLLSGLNSRNENLLELICKAYCHMSLNEGTEDIDIHEYCEALLNINKNSIHGQITLAISQYNNGNIVECRDTFNKVLEVDNQNWLPYKYLAEVYLRLHCFQDALTCTSHTLNMKSKDMDDRIRARFAELNLEAMARSGAIDLCNRCLDHCLSLPSAEQKKIFTLRCTIYAAITLMKWNIVKDKLDEFTQSASDRNFCDEILLRSLYVSGTKSPEDAVYFLQNELSDKEKEEFAPCWILLGELFWKLEKVDDALDSFLRAAKLAPYIYISFLYLGHYYKNVTNDLTKARRCYQKAFQLNPRSKEVGISLSDTYHALGLSEDNYNLLNNLTTANGDCWAWMRLGLHHLRERKAESAVQCLRVCVRSNPQNSYCWELLGDACFSRGSFTAAIKCYQKCLDLDPSSFYAKLQLALVKQRIGLHDESILVLRTLIEEYRECVPALKGLAETCLTYVRELFDKQMLLTARDFCEEAAIALTKILTQKNRLTCVWKLLGDACIWVCHLPTKFAFLKLPSILSESNSKKEFQENDTEVFSKDSLFDLALRFYKTALTLSQDNGVTTSSLWRDVAFSYHLKANHIDVEDEKIQTRRQALSAAKNCICSYSKEWRSWNLLGVIALSKEIDNAPLAQHSFIKALDLEMNNALVWNNLGAMYLQLEDIHLANEAFRVAQKSDPKYSRSWIGQAVIAETVDHDETVDLLYHTTVLGYHEESAKAFAEWICKILKEWDTYKSKPHCYYIVEKMYGLQVATTVLSWYAVHHPEDVSAANMLAVLLELCQLNRTATRVLEDALKLASNEEKDVIFSNLGRQLRKLGKYDKAIQYFKQIKEIDFNAQCEFALALFLNGQYEESVTNYESAIHWLAPDDGWKAQVMVAVAALKYLKNEKKEAQAMLLECTRLKPVPVYGLLAACAFGMLNKELMLSKLVLKELEAFHHNEEYIQHIALFNSFYQIFQGNFKTAISVMSKFVHNHPGNASLWLSLCLMLLQLIFLSQKEYLVHSSAIAQHAQYSIILGRGTIDISKISSIVSLSYLLAGRVEECLRNARKAVFTHPDVAENWAVLIAASCVQGRQHSSSMKSLIKFVQDKLLCTKGLNLWLCSIEAKLCV